MKLTLSNPRTWIVIVLSLLLVTALMSPFGGESGLSVTEAAPAPSTVTNLESEPASGMGDRAGVQDVVTYTVRNSSGKVIEQGTTGAE